MGLLQATPGGISKVMKIPWSLPNLNDKDFRSKESTKKKNYGRKITPSYFPTLMNMAIFGHFSQLRAKWQNRLQPTVYWFWIPKPGLIIDNFQSFYLFNLICLQSFEQIVKLSKQRGHCNNLQPRQPSFDFQIQEGALAPPEFGVLEKRTEREIDSLLLSAPPDLKTLRQL